jgi:hypothetical protein
MHDRDPRAEELTNLRLALATFGIMLGLVAEFAFMRPSTKLIMSSFAARWVGRQQNVGWKFQHGCSTGRPALTPSL